MLKVRVDKWLWSVRLFKSRSMATEACRSGKVRVNQHVIKPSHMLVVGNQIEVKKNGFNFSFDVLHLLDKRVSATLAAPCYTDVTPVEELNKYKDWFVSKSGSEYRQKGDGRPTKKERREIDGFKEFYLDEEDEDLI
ncbi:MAG: S4 domain-containing protein [Saprospiraceae bacterium]